MPKLNLVCPVSFRQRHLADHLFISCWLAAWGPTYSSRAWQRNLHHNDIQAQTFLYFLFPSAHCCIDSRVVSVLLTVLFWEAAELASADCEAAALSFSCFDSSFAEGGRRMHIAACPSRMTFGLETNPTITPICCTICSRDVSCGKKKTCLRLVCLRIGHFSGNTSSLWQLSLTLFAITVKLTVPGSKEGEDTERVGVLACHGGMQLQTTPTECNIKRDRNVIT